MTFSPEVLKAERGKEFRWLGKFLVKGLVDGEHYFLLEQTPGAHVHICVKIPFL